MNQIDVIENNKAELEHLYDDLKKKTLDLAIRESSFRRNRMMSLQANY